MSVFGSKLQIQVYVWNNFFLSHTQQQQQQQPFQHLKQRQQQQQQPPPPLVVNIILTFLLFIPGFCLSHAVNLRTKTSVF